MQSAIVFKFPRAFTEVGFPKGFCETEETFIRYRQSGADLLGGLSVAFDQVAHSAQEALVFELGIGECAAKFKRGFWVFSCQLTRLL